MQNRANETASPQIQVTAPTGAIDIYHEVLTGIQTGSYAVLLAIAVVYVMTRKSLGRAWHKHFEMLETLRSVQASNAKSIAMIAESNKRVADAISDGRGAVNTQTIETIKRELTVAQTAVQMQQEGSNGQKTT